MVGDGLWGQKDGDNYIIPIINHIIDTIYFLVKFSLKKGSFAS
jgi:hypothetical protein